MRGGFGLPARRGPRRRALARADDRPARDKGQMLLLRALAELRDNGVPAH